MTLGADAHAAPCGNWVAGLTAAAHSTSGSKAFDIDWNAGPAPCTNASTDDWDGTDHHEIHRASGATAPSTPDASTLVKTTSSSVVTWDDFVHRSNKQYSYAVFACEDTSCSSWYGDDPSSDETVSGDTASSTTDREEYVLDGITGSSDISSTISSDSTANAPHAFYYPSGWKTGRSGKLALYYSTPGTGSEASEVYYRLHDATGWPPVGFNDSTSWANQVLVAEGSTTSTDDDYRADHPWAMLTRDSGTKRVQLFVQSQTTSNKKVLQIESDDEVGDDFGLGCSSSSCTDTFLTGDGYIAIDADGTSATDYVEQAQHSRVAWGYIADPIIDAGTDEPFMTFQLDRPGSGDCSDTGNDDIGWADGSWNSSTSQWDWEVETDGGSPDCPVVHIDDGHDSAVMPLPDGEYKLYYQDWGTDDWYVTHWDGSDWVDETTIEVYWDGGGSGPTHDCIANITHIAYKNGSTTYEGVFFRLLDSADADCATGFDDDFGASNDDARIVFAELDN